MDSFVDSDSPVLPASFADQLTLVNISRIWLSVQYLISHDTPSATTQISVARLLICDHGATREVEGVVETLAELSKYVRMAIVTTAKRVDFEIIHEKRQVRQFMEFVLVREDYKLTKPHPEPYLTGIKRLGATKEETLVVEDSSRGLNSAVAAGIDCAIVYTDFTKTHDFSQASYRIETLIELKDIVLNVT
jgi:beta-phosphoglucomutase-like phosphatase (HAD superfamily)